MNKVSKKGLIEKVTFEQRWQGGEEVSQMALRRDGIPGRGTARAEVWSGERAWHSRGIAKRPEPAWLQGKEGGGGGS